MDAAIMDGRTLSAGGVCSVKRLKNPILAARKVMELTEHVLMSGEGAEKFAAENGCEIVDQKYFWTQLRWDQYLKLKGRIDERKASSQVSHGTVGAVALDIYGNLASATSTGGSHNKLPGRIGDSALIGAGTYANNGTCAISCSGVGEFFIRTCAGFEISSQLEIGQKKLNDAVKTTLKGKIEALGGEGGVIAIDKQGNIVLEFNTERMSRGFVRGNEEIYVSMFKD